MDTAGRDDRVGMYDSHMKQTNGIIWIYSIESRKSFDAVRNDGRLNVDRVTLIAGENYPKLGLAIVGNKCDLVEERVVLKNEGKELAKEVGAVFFEISAKTRENVEEMFIGIVRECIKKSSFQTMKSKRNKKNKCTLV